MRTWIGLCTSITKNKTVAAVLTLNPPYPQQAAGYFFRLVADREMVVKRVLSARNALLFETTICPMSKGNRLTIGLIS